MQKISLLLVKPAGRLTSSVVWCRSRNKSVMTKDALFAALEMNNEVVVRSSFIPSLVQCLFNPQATVVYVLLSPSFFFSFFSGGKLYFLSFFFVFFFLFWVCCCSFEDLDDLLTFLFSFILNCQEN